MASSPERNSEQFTQTISQYEGLNIGFSLFGASMPLQCMNVLKTTKTTPDLKPIKNFENKKVRKTAQQNKHFSEIPKKER